MRAWFSIWTAPMRREGLLDEVVLLVVERGAAEVREAERAVDAPAVAVGVLPAVLAGAR